MKQKDEKTINHMKKIIFIGGTSYSGSTLMDMILSNDSSGFSCGEVVALFRPFKNNHLRHEFHDGANGYDIWNKLKNEGERNLYKNIFTYFPQVKFIVDSSKDPLWIQSQSGYAKKDNIPIKNLVIWKTPYESALSFQKRGRLNEFAKSWINYHRLYFTLIKDFKSIKYYDLTNNKDALKALCNYVDIPYSDNKLNYWEKNHGTLFGNRSAKIHLANKDSAKFNEIKDYLNKRDSQIGNFTINDEHKKIYYNNPLDKRLKDYIDKICKINCHMNNIVRLLNLCSPCNREFERDATFLSLLSSLKMNHLAVNLRKTKNSLGTVLLKYKEPIRKTRGLL